MTASATVVGYCEQQVEDERVDNGGEDSMADGACTVEIVRWWFAEIDGRMRAEGDGGLWR